MQPQIQYNKYSNFRHGFVCRFKSKRTKFLWEQTSSAGLQRALPQCEGPKLQPFPDPKPVVKFHRLLSDKDADGHARVFEASINSTAYAVKIVSTTTLLRPSSMLTSSDGAVKVLRLRDTSRRFIGQRERSFTGRLFTSPLRSFLQ